MTLSVFPLFFSPYKDFCIIYNDKYQRVTNDTFESSELILPKSYFKNIQNLFEFNNMYDLNWTKVQQYVC